MVLFYTPKTNYTQNIMEKVKQILQAHCTEKVNITLADNEHEIRSKTVKGWSFKNLPNIGGVSFENVETGSKLIPEKIHYNIISKEMYFTRHIYRAPQFLSYDPAQPESMEFIRGLFVAIQAAVDLAHIQLLQEEQSETKTTFNIFAQQFPIPKINENMATYDSYEGAIITSYFVICFLTIIPVLVKRIVEEKTTRVKEYVSCCGVTPALYWLTTIVDSFCVLTIDVILLLFFLSLKNFNIKVYSESWLFRDVISVSFLNAINISYPLLFISLLLYCLQSSLFACFISVFFNNPNVSAAVTIVLWPLTYLYTLLIAKVKTFKAFDLFSVEVMSAFFPNSALYWLFHVFTGRQFLVSEPSSFSNIFESSRWLDTLNAFHVLFIMVISTVIYALLVWYLSAVWPWQQGVRKPWFFPFRKIYSKYILKMPTNGFLLSDEPHSPLFVSHVSKDFSTRKEVLKDVSFELHENSLTVLLGPNGSGKSTLINIISGATEATRGRVLVKGNNIIENMEDAQSHLGICPQYNTYFKYLTLKEQLEMIYTLKCVLRERTDGIKVDEILKLLDLESDANQMAHLLSSGNLRRMTLAMAMIGPCDVLVLDEPSESLDPVAKKKVWDVLVEARKTKTILVCSHHLDEINVIADFVAILINGELKCMETTLNLKKKFGSGYKVKILRNIALMTEETIKNIVNNHIPSAIFEKIRQNTEEIAFDVKFEESKRMSDLLQQLESESFSLGIKSITVYVTTLEDAYIRLIENKCEQEDAKEWSFDNRNDAVEVEASEAAEIIQSGVRKFTDSFIALALKNFKYTLRNYSIFGILIVIPAILTLCSLSLFEFAANYYNSLSKNDNIFNDKLYGPDIQAFVASNDWNFIENYKQSFQTSKEVHIYNGPNDRLQEWLLFFSEKSLRTYFTKLLLGATLAKSSNVFNLTIWYNPSGTYILPISLNLATTAILNNISKSTHYSISVVNKMFAEKQESYRHRFYYPEYRYSHTSVIIFIIFIYSICFSTYLLRPIAERRNGFKQLQLMTGIQPIIYWAVNFAFDLILNLFCSLFLILIYYIYDRENFFIGSEMFFIPMFVIFFFGGFGNIPFAYLISFMFNKPTTGYIFKTISNTLIGLMLIGLIETSVFPKFLRCVLLVIFPLYSYAKGLVSVHKALNYNTFCDRISNVLNLERECGSDLLFSSLKTCCRNLCNNHTYKNDWWQFYSKCHEHINPLAFYYDEINAIDCIGFLTASGFIYFSIITLVEYSSIRVKICYSCNLLLRKISAIRNNGRQDIVIGEVEDERNYVKELIKNNRISSEAIVVHKLTKSFKNRKIPDNLSFSVHKSECFGLLGGNGSGKTTTFRLITSQLRPSFGNAYINDVNTSLTQNNRKYLSEIGYCPQNDALFDCLTGFETLSLFMKLRGIKSVYHLKRIVNKFHLQSVINQRVSTYSGGNRRKLSLALALIGNPKLLLLDEPTNGVDPNSRHKVWELLKNILETFHISMLLTSHNMEEVEALCNRVAVMANGKLQCIGSLNTLKEKFGRGFNVVLKVEREYASSEQHIEKVKLIMLSYFGAENVVLKYENFGVFYYHIISQTMNISNVFEIMERIKLECNVEDYIASNATLENALLTFMGQTSFSNLI
ncbi:ATP-binding cassette sub-family A member 1-like protein [Dinothrombium tinctorium]|uniref:ATP-binding cassette sub-family A member 1-like protein n=1 Tax=Dinothrombium tinctorium TaxID=1965070 RepID=A0A3S3NMZ6_9ACAR|nr:ATP-binding cassette sub-family A member 1-like protein [Dinothrombium tinctorium]